MRKRAQNTWNKPFSFFGGGRCLASHYRAAHFLWLALLEMLPSLNTQTAIHLEWPQANISLAFDLIKTSNVTDILVLKDVIGRGTACEFVSIGKVWFLLTGRKRFFRLCASVAGYVRHPFMNMHCMIEIRSGVLAITLFKVTRAISFHVTKSSGRPFFLYPFLNRNRICKIKQKTTSWFPGYNLKWWRNLSNSPSNKNQNPFQIKRFILEAQTGCCPRYHRKLW